MDKILNSIAEADLSGLRMPIVTMYRSPKDYPGKCVARIWDGDRPTETVVIKDTVGEIDEDMHRHTSMFWIPPTADDDPAIMGAWI